MRRLALANERAEFPIGFTDAGNILPRAATAPNIRGRKGRIVFTAISTAVRDDSVFH
jgi:hypothetical protein